MITKKLELSGHEGAVMYLAWSPDDKYLATTSEKRIVYKIETCEGSQAKTPL